MVTSSVPVPRRSRRGRCGVAFAAGLALLAPPAAAQTAGRPPVRPVSAAVAVPGVRTTGPVIPLSLPSAVLIGLRKNRAVRTAYLQRIADRFSLYVAEDTFSPRVNLNAAYTRARAAGITTTTVNAAPTITWALPTGATLSGGLTNAQNNTPGQAGSAFSQLSFQVIQPLLRGAGLDIANAPIRLGRIAEKGAKLRLAQSVIDNVTQIVLAYRALIQSNEQLRIAEDSLKRSRTLLETNRILIAAGRLAAVELVQSEASIAQGELSVATARNDADAARLALLILLALDPDSRIVAADKLQAIPVRVDEGRALQVAFERQPTYLAQLLTIETSKINLAVAQNQRLWDLSLVGGGGQGANGTGIFQSLQGLRGNKTDYSAGVQLSIPLFDPAREQGEVNATVSLRQAELQTAQLRDQTGQQVRNAVRTVEIQGGQLQTAKRARELAAQQLDIELTKLQVGRSSNFQVVSFQNSLQQAENAELAAIVAYLNALTNLDQALGTTLDTWGIDLNDR